MHQHDPEALQTFVEIVLNKINTRDAFISFPTKHGQNMLLFLHLAVTLLPDKHWLVHLPQTDNTSQTGKPMRNVMTVDGIKTRFPKLAREVRDVPTYRVGIRFSEKTDATGKQFSTMLRYVSHILGICMLTEGF